MLPCQSRCPQYYEGCHKTCAAWKKYQAASAEDHRRRRAYLDYYSRLCADVERRCWKVDPHWTLRYRALDSVPRWIFSWNFSGHFSVWDWSPPAGGSWRPSAPGAGSDRLFSPE